MKNSYKIEFFNNNMIEIYKNGLSMVITCKLEEIYEEIKHIEDDDNIMVVMKEYKRIKGHDINKLNYDQFRDYISKF